MAKRIVGTLVLFLPLLLLSCGDGGTDVITPTGINAVSGNGQTGTVGQALSQTIVARVVGGRDNSPISGVNVSFSTSDGSVSPTSATTGGDGTASATWTLGTTAGAQQATATAEGLSVTFNATAQPGPVASLAISPTPSTFTAFDDTEQLSAGAEDQYGNAISSAGETWSSTNEAVATVSNSGLVTAVGNGTAQITATAGSLADTVDVEVAQEAADVAITGVDRLSWGDTEQFQGSAEDANGNPVAGGTVTWSTADAAIASVDAGGLVTGEGLGTVDIIATSGTLADSMAVTVTPVPDASLANGIDSGCLLDETGAAYCWGSNSFGQLGDGTNNYSNEPVAVAGGHTFVALGTAFYGHYCALAETGAAYCWGWNSSGQLGDGTTTTSSVPVQVAGGHSFRMISTAYYHTCALDEAGDAYCWGDNGYGQLGDGTTTDRMTPTAVSTSLAFDALDVNGYTSCALDGTDAYCWGNNLYGQVGDGTTASPRNTPITVAGGNEFASIAVGFLHTCGMTTAGEPNCWGYNIYGQLGDGTTTNASVPTAVSDLGTVDQISAHAYTSCAVASNTAYCWGYNGVGALGDGTTTSRQTPTMVIGGISWKRVLSGYQVSCGVSVDDTPYCWGYTQFVGDGSTLEQATPVAALGGITFANVSAGSDMTCAVTGTEAYCWGNNAYGQLGLGDIEPRSEPEQITAQSLTQVSTGQYHACGLTSAGNAYCWGNNSNGQLGNGTTTDSDVPVAVGAGFTFSEITVGDYHTCGIRASNGAAYCWGYNSPGRLGDGTTTTRTSPVPVAGGHTFAVLAAGGAHTCGVAGTGTTYCWGYNGYGELGDGTTTNRTTPTATAGGVGFVGVTAGAYHTCGLTIGNLAYCWGANYYGQIGDGTTTNRTSPRAVSGGVTFDYGDAGRDHTCAVGTAGTAYCWGYGGNGRLGNGSTTNQSAPTPIQGGYTMATVSAGSNHSCGVTTGGDMYCWGYAGSGALGNGQSFVSDPVMVAGGYTLPTSAYLGDMTSFRWGRPTLGEPIHFAPEELRAIRERIKEQGLPTVDPMHPEGGGEIQQ